jgi:hypothetical protein
MPPMYAHLLRCLRCRREMVTAVSVEVRGWRHTMVCEIRESLFNEWQDAVNAYATTIAELTTNVGSNPASELLKLATMMEVNRKLTAQARAELDRHIAEHCC